MAGGVGFVDEGLFAGFLVGVYFQTQRLGERGDFGLRFGERLQRRLQYENKHQTAGNGGLGTIGIAAIHRDCERHQHERKQGGEQHGIVNLEPTCKGLRELHEAGRLRCCSD